MSEVIIIKISRDDAVSKERAFFYTGSGRILIGRDANCNIRFKDRSVSRQHCEITIDIPRLTIRDLGSTNGTFLNGVNIRSGWSVSKEMTDGRLHLGLGKYSDITISTVSNVKCHCLICNAEMEDAAGFIHICSHCRENEKKKVRWVKEFLQTIEKRSRPSVRYRKIRPVGRGTTGDVYLAENVKTNEEVALKLVCPETQYAGQLFEREMHLMQQLEHENLVKLYECGTFDNMFFIAMEYCRGGSVNELIRRSGGRLELPLATAILFQTLDGLDCVHNANVPAVLDGSSAPPPAGAVHRDIKPSSLLISNSDVSRPAIKITAPGLAGACETLAGIRPVREAARFMSRMQFRNRRYAAPDADVWSAMATYFYMLTGHYVREYSIGETDTWEKVYNLHPAPVRRYASHIPESLANVIDEALIDFEEECRIRKMVDRCNGPELAGKYGKKSVDALVLKKLVREALPPECLEEVLRILPAYQT
ncbi:MAG: FHA domain-containing protein [Tannerella sp.]|jgi:hypothetical protein|nr:FHA domain-containing protein [Tannerella sp.]